MSFRTILRGAGWMIGTQAAIGIAQFGYSAIAARIFSPALFGAFAAALAFQGLLALVTTTGLASFVLSERSLSRSVISRVRAYAIIGGAVSALIYFAFSGYWLALLNVTGGATFVGPILLAQFFGPIAAVESALLRRERIASRDAISLAGAFLISSSIGLVAIVNLGDAWTLALSTTLNPVTLLVLAWSLRTTRQLDAGLQIPHARLIRHSSRLAMQSSVFFVLAQSPGWIVSARFGSSALGQYSRASTLAGIPAVSMSTAIVRAVQPYWAHVRGRSNLSAAFVDVALLSSGLAFPAFAVFAATGPFLTRIWLGPGWELAGELVPWLAAAFAIQVPFIVLSNAAEMRQHFVSTRAAQVAIGVSLIPGIAGMIISDQVWLVGLALAQSQAVGLIVLVMGLSARNRLMRVTLLRGLFVQLCCALGIYVVASIGAMWVFRLAEERGAWPDALAVISGLTLGILILVVTWRWNSARRILAARGVGVRRPGAEEIETSAV